MECYEDMFKEISQKLYGEEETDGMMAEYENLSTLATIQSTSTSFTGTIEEDNWVSSEEVIPWTQSKIASYNNLQQLFRCNECECVGYLSRIAEHWLGTHANLRVFQCPQCPYASAWARCVRMHLARQHNIIPDQNLDPLATCWKENPVLEEVTKFLQRLKNKVELEARTSSVNNEEEGDDDDHEFQPQEAMDLESSMNSPQEDANQPGVNKRYNCRYCPYATDRRDLYTRHENIHRDDKPFHCYICLKHFNRADHVKKHFVRMHRDVPYDINRIKREVNKDNLQTFFEAQPKAVEPIIPIKQEVIAFETESPQQGQSQLQHPEDIQQAQELQCTEQIQQLQQEAHSEQQQTQVQLQVEEQTQIIQQEPRPRKEKLPKRKPGEKRYTCCYCSWSGVDNWCLKRHLNTHLKPYICKLCEYKAARSERLATHMYKVHNKRSCSKCSFTADDQAGLTTHLQEHHPNYPILYTPRGGLLSA
ncbi:protein charlatan isoform X2 [Cimex lectularius]|uniref:C2H2-type domain-containing protein n=1 Tax=Cimex lectularius TaxID=79782 RepID=A0A8I6SIH6_CIMLE|nr:protein charlatan isoform X2 [Cimex lectularius]